MMKLLSAVAKDSAAVVNQSRAAEGDDETVNKSFSCMIESPQSASPDDVEDRSSAECARDERKNKDIESREVIINYGDDSGFTANEILESIEIESTSKKVTDAFTISRETYGNIQVIVDTSEKIGIMLMDKDICSVTSSLISRDVQINIASGEAVCDNSLEMPTKRQNASLDNIESGVVPSNKAGEIKQSEFPDLHSREALVAQHSITETSGEIVNMCSSYVKVSNPISSTDMDWSTIERVENGEENKDIAISCERYDDITMNEKREIMLYNHGVSSGLMVSEMIGSIQVELTSEEEIDAFIVSKEANEDIKAIVESDEENETMLMLENACSVMSSWKLHNVQILTSVEEIDVCLISISTHSDDKWKRHYAAGAQVKTNHGEKNQGMTCGEIMSDSKLTKQPSIFSGIKESCDDPCAIHPGVYRFEIKVHIKEEGKESFFRNSRLSPLLRRSTRRALALIKDTSPLSNPLSIPVVKDLNSDHNQLNENGDGVENSANEKEVMTKSETDLAEDCTNMEKDTNQVKIGHYKNSANAKEDVKESKSGRVPSSILRKSILKKKKESKELWHDEKSVYSTFSTDTYNSFQSLVRDVEKEVLLCFVKVGRFLGL